MSRYQKDKTNLDFTEARNSEWKWHQLGHMQVCTSLQTDDHASTPPLSFLQARCPSCRPTNSVKALKALKKRHTRENCLISYSASWCIYLLHYVHKLDMQGGTRHLPPPRRRTLQLLSGRGGCTSGQTSLGIDAKRQTAGSRVSEPAVSR